MSGSVGTLVDKVAACQEACNVCFNACLEEEHVAMMAECIRTDRDCADICGIVLDFAHRESSIFSDLVEVCIKACSQCAAECEKHDHDHCQECAKACRECESACRAYLDGAA